MENLDFLNENLSNKLVISIYPRINYLGRVGEGRKGFAFQVRGRGRRVRGVFKSLGYERGWGSNLGRGEGLDEVGVIGRGWEGP